MTEDSLRALLQSVRSQEQSVDDAIARLRSMPFEDLGFAKVDHHRAIRCGFPEVIYCEGKTIDQVAEIFDCCARTGANLLATRASNEIRDAIEASVCVPISRHREGPVSEDLLYHLQVYAVLGQPRTRRMTKRVEVEAVAVAVVLG